MSPRAQRTLLRLLALFLASGAGDATIQFATAGFYDWRHLAGVLVVAGVMTAEKYLGESNNAIASPSVRAVNLMQQTDSPSVAPPTVHIPKSTLTLGPHDPG